MFLPPLAPTFDAALRDTGSKKVEFRLAAASRLADPPESRVGEAVDGLVLLVGDETARVRAAALESIGELEASLCSSTEAVESGRAKLEASLINGLEDPAPWVREAAVQALSRWRSSTAKAALARCVTSAFPELRAHAVVALALAEPSQALKPLALALADEDSDVRLNAVRAFHSIVRQWEGQPGEGAPGEGAPGEGAPGEGAPGEGAPEEGAPEEDKQARVPFDATLACEDLIAPRLKDEDLEVRLEAALALTACKTSSPLPADTVSELLTALSTPSRAIEAALAIAELASQGRLHHDATRARQVLGQMLRRWTVRGHLRVAVAVALVMLGDLQGLTVLRRTIRSRLSAARPFAVELAGQFRIRPLRPDLETLRERPKGLLPKLVAESLEQIPTRVNAPKPSPRLPHAM